MGPSAQGKNTAHQKKNLSPAERVDRAREYGIPLSEDEARAAAFYLPPEHSPERKYLTERRRATGPFLPARRVDCPSLTAPPLALFSDALSGSAERTISTTSAMVRMLSKLLKDKQLGKYIVPIVPDEARTFGMDGLFPIAGIYSPEGQNYTPVDAGTLAPYREATDGQILQEGICETGAIASFLAAGTAYAVHGIPMIPFYIFYSMFGFQRVGDMIWSGGDMFTRGFLLGGTAGRTTLNGEGLQHQDGHSHVLANTLPNLKSYDPAFAYELAVIVQDGIRRMYQNQEDLFYYLTLYNENYSMPPMPDLTDNPELEQQILSGAYLYLAAETTGQQRDNEFQKSRVNLLASGSILQQAIQARDKLQALGIATNLFSVTSFNELYRDAVAVERTNRLNPEAKPMQPYLSQLFNRHLQTQDSVFVAVSDYVQALPNSIGRWIPGDYTTLGTDGYGVCDTREELRRYFEIDPGTIASAALNGLRRAGLVDSAELAAGLEQLGSLRS